MSADPTGRDPLGKLDDPDYPALTMSQAAELLGVQAAFLRSLDTSGVLQPHRSAGGHRRYSRQQLSLAARVRELLDDGHSLASAETIVGLQDQLADARADADALRSDAAALGRTRPRSDPTSTGSAAPPADGRRPSSPPRHPPGV
jgi:DNA-binding transcriptional MerR regulator